MLGNVAAVVIALVELIELSQARVLMFLKRFLPLLILITIGLFYWGCTPTSSGNYTNRTQTIRYQEPSPILLSETATPRASQQVTPSIESGGEMEKGVLYFEYSYFQLEGIPPYPSPYVTMVSISRYWIDMNDPNRFHHEGSFRTQEATPVEGMEFIRTGTGTNGVSESCEFYEGRPDCVQNPITTTLSIAE